MQIVILDEHLLADSRINRHIKYMSDHNYDLFRININRSLSCKLSGMKLDKTIPCYVLGCAYTKISNLNRIFYNIQRFIINNEDFKHIMNQLGISHEIPTTIHVHDPILLPCAEKLSHNFHSVKIVYDRHEVYESKRKYFSIISLPAIGRISEILSTNKIDGVVTVLEEYRCSVEKMFPRSEIAVVPNFPVFDDYDDKIILSKIANVSKAKVFQFVYIGSLDWNYDRDIALIIYLAEELLSNDYNVRFVIGGSTTDEKLLSEFTRLKSKYLEKFIYAGYLSRDQAIQYTQESHFGFLLIKPNTDYWVLTSPNKVFEYLRCGVIPVLRAKCSFKNLLKNNSIWFEREDSKEQILETIKLILDDTDRISDQMIRSYQLSSRFSYESVAHEYVALYESIWGS